MDTFTRLLRGTSAWLLSFSLFMVASAVALTLTILNANYIKSSLVKSGTYDHILSSTLNLATIPVSAGSTTTQLDPNTIKELEPVIAAAITPSFIQKVTESVIDGTFVWLKGGADMPNFSINAADVKAALQTNVTAYVNDRLAKLPVCTSIDQVNNFDPLSTTCKPPVTISQSDIQSSVSSFVDSLPLMQNQEISLQSLDLAKNFTSDKPIHSVPTFYKIAVQSPYIFGGLAIISMAGVIYLSKPRSAAWKTIGHTFLWAGILLAVTGALTLVLLNSLKPGFLGSSSQQQLDFVNTIFTPLINVLSKSLAMYSLYFGVAYAVIGAVLYTIAHRIRLDRIQIEKP